ncbi:MAG: hypothetical protein GYB55_08805 [Cytophagales bacterium]|nr:hypothetical protein [Cytophagales bacterium]|tara:strand:- start:26223 stop:26735 length:513 start_codon:yes stop_codon:yes gene_type:complete
MAADNQIKEMKKDFRLLERNVLLLIAIPLPIFSFAYLYVTSGNLDFNLPALPEMFNYILLGLVSAMLVFQQFAFTKRIKEVRKTGAPVNQKLKGYAKATFLRYWQLFWIGVLCAFGLFFYENQGFTIVYAVTLLFVSLAKPMPARIVSALRLKGEEKDQVMEIQKREALD